MANLERMNWVNIELIPKMISPKCSNDYRPISLLNSSYKIISKILANRLSRVINSLVDDSQSAFIKGRCIADNIIASQEVIFNLQKMKLLDHVFKVDFAKAFNSLDWNFLLDILFARGFGSRWISQISTILNSAKARILVNGKPHGYIRCKQGLKQGDPLSPMLFALAPNTLSAMVLLVLHSKVLVGVPVEPSDNICHLQYADDLIIFSTREQDDVRIIKLILYLFEGSSRLTINFSKSCLFSTNYEFQSNASSAAILNCNKDCLPLTYLGVPLSSKLPRRHNWLKLILMVWARLMSQKANYLSLGGHLTLLNYVLSSIPTYQMTVFQLSSQVIKETDKVQRDFLQKGPELGPKGFRLIT